jgi:hypothetical protein
MSDITIPILSPHIYFQYYKNILWTTTPLLNTEVNLENNSNVLYSYTIDDALQSVYTPIALSFIQGNIHNFQVIDDDALDGRAVSVFLLDGD